jgi:hypothetical protein
MASLIDTATTAIGKIVTNGKNAITGALLNDALNSIFNGAFAEENTWIRKITTPNNSTINIKAGADGSDYENENINIWANNAVNITGWCGGINFITGGNEIIANDFYTLSLIHYNEDSSLNIDRNGIKIESDNNVHLTSGDRSVYITGEARVDIYSNSGELYMFGEGGVYITANEEIRLSTDKNYDISIEADCIYEYANEYSLICPNIALIVKSSDNNIVSKLSVVDNGITAYTSGYDIQLCTNENSDGDTGDINIDSCGNIFITANTDTEIIAHDIIETAKSGNLFLYAGYVDSDNAYVSDNNIKLYGDGTTALTINSSATKGIRMSSIEGPVGIYSNDDITINTGASGGAIKLSADNVNLGSSVEVSDGDNYVTIKSDDITIGDTTATLNINQDDCGTIEAMCSYDGYDNAFAKLGTCSSNYISFYNYNANLYNTKGTITLGQYNSSTIAVFTYIKVDVPNGVLNLSASKSITASSAITTSSDIRYKNILNDITLSVEDIANAPFFEFSYKDSEDVTFVGTSAQYWQDVCPKAVVETEGKLSLNYSGLALGAATTIAKEVVELKKENETLKAENKAIKTELETLKAELNELKNIINNLK